MLLGQSVLTKIENIITQIEKPKNKKPYFPKSPPKLTLDHSTIPVFEKLHNISKLRKLKSDEQTQLRITHEMQELSPFKVSNKHSIFLLSRSSRKPLHERTEDVLRQREEEIARLRQIYPPKKSELDEDSLLMRELQERKNKERKYTQEELNKKLMEMDRREKTRIYKINQGKLNALEKYSEEFRCKPYLGPKSSRIWQKCQLNRQLSSSVFERFEQYEVQRKVHLEQTERTLREKLTPFNPKISDTSRLLASKCPSRRSLHAPLEVERSLSCRCLQRGNKNHQNSTALQTSRLCNI